MDNLVGTVLSGFDIEHKKKRYSEPYINFSKITKRNTNIQDLQRGN